MLIRGYTTYLKALFVLHCAALKPYSRWHEDGKNCVLWCARKVSKKINSFVLFGLLVSTPLRGNHLKTDV